MGKKYKWVAGRSLHGYLWNGPWKNNISPWGSSDWLEHTSTLRYGYIEKGRLRHYFLVNNATLQQVPRLTIAIRPVVPAKSDTSSQLRGRDWFISFKGLSISSNISTSITQNALRYLCYHLIHAVSMLSLNNASLLWHKVRSCSNRTTSRRRSIFGQ